LKPTSHQRFRKEEDVVQAMILVQTHISAPTEYPDYRDSAYELNQQLIEKSSQKKKKKKKKEKKGER
jgi:hypothetical protein